MKRAILDMVKVRTVDICHVLAPRPDKGILNINRHDRMRMRYNNCVLMENKSGDGQKSSGYISANYLV